MHALAMKNAKRFFDTYVTSLGQVTVVDIGAQDVNGSLRDACPRQAKYIGVDFAQGKGVDVVLDDPYTFPFADNSIDVAVSSSCFEHSEMFWVLFLEIMRVLKPSGLFYLNAPSHLAFHRYPVDCYRFFPDSGNALAKWGQRNGFNSIALEHYTTIDGPEYLGDYVCVFLKDKACLNHHSSRIVDQLTDFRNGARYPEFETLLSPMPQ